MSAPDLRDDLRPFQGPGASIYLGDPDYRIAILATVGINLLVLSIPFYINRIYVSVIPGQDANSLASLSVLLAIALAFDLALKIGRSRLLTLKGAELEHRLRLRVARRLLAAPIAVVGSQSPATHLEELRAPSLLRNYFEQVWLVRWVDLPFVVIYLLVLGLIGGWLVLVPLVLLPIFGWLLRRESELLARSQQRELRHRSFRDDILLSSLANPDVIKGLSMQGFLARRYEPWQEQLGLASWSIQQHSNRLLNLATLYAQLTQIGIVTLGAYLVMNQQLTTAALAACTLLGGQVVMPLRKLLTSSNAQVLSRQATRALLAVADLSRESLGGTLPLAEPPEGSSLTVRDWEFPNPYNRQLRRVPRLDLDGGPPLLVSGGDAGDSTGLFRSLVDFSGMHEGHGTCLLGDIALGTLPLVRWRRWVCYLSQRDHLFRGTLLENLTGFHPDTDGSEAIAFCEQIGIGQAIRELPLGFRTPIGEGADYPLRSELAFQVQVAAALLVGPRVLLLDLSDRQPSPALLDWLLKLPWPCATAIALPDGGTFRSWTWSNGVLLDAPHD